MKEAQLLVVSDAGALAKPEEIFDKVSRQDIVDMMVQRKIEAVQAEVQRLEGEYVAAYAAWETAKQEFSARVNQHFCTVAAEMYGPLCKQFKLLGAEFRPENEWFVISDWRHNAKPLESGSVYVGKWVQAVADDREFDGVKNLVAEVVVANQLTVHGVVHEAVWNAITTMDAVTALFEADIAAVQDAYRKQRALARSIHDLQATVKEPEAVARQMKARWTESILAQAGVDVEGFDFQAP